jgi:alanyl-tRNA synthetase
VRTLLGNLLRPWRPYSGGPPEPDEDGDRFVEIWNLVFMQYEQAAGEIVSELPKKSIDTGMGLERVAAVLQGVHDNYDTDTFKALIAAERRADQDQGRGESQASHRVIADHLRASGFLVADGVLPANEGRGYVLRRIMRRAMRHAHLLGAKDPLIVAAWCPNWSPKWARPIPSWSAPSR